MGRASASVAVLTLVLSTSGGSWWDRVTGGTAMGTAAGFAGGDPGTSPPPPPGGMPSALHHNPGDLYFTNAQGKEVYLRGTHTWPNVQDYTATGAFDFTKYLSVIKENGDNFIRGWMFDAPHSDADGGHLTPYPWVQTADGRFDLTRVNPTYITRLEDRVDQAGQEGFYFSVMMGQGWTLHQPAAWEWHPFRAGNNVNGVASNPDEAQTLASPAVVAAWELLVRTVVAAVANRPNVLFEVGNEFNNTPETWDFQRHMVSAIKAADPYNRPVAISGPAAWTGNQGTIEAEFAASDIDWRTPDGGSGANGFQAENPIEADGRDVSVIDTDHIWGYGGSARLVWATFARGHGGMLNMDPLQGLGISGTHPNFHSGRGEADVRQGMRQVGIAADMLNLNDFQVMSARSSEGFLVGNAAAGNFAGFDPNGGEVTLDLSGVSGSLDVYFFDLDAGTRTQVADVMGGGTVTLTAPSAGAQGFILRADGTTSPPPPRPPPRPPAQPR